MIVFFKLRKGRIPYFKIIREKYLKPFGLYKIFTKTKLQNYFYTQGVKNKNNI